MAAWALTGGTGADAFVFGVAPSAANREGITDFSVKDDTIQLNDVVFKGLKAGRLAADAFKAAAKATDATDRIVYDGRKGYLTFDPDGSGSKDGVHFATLSTGLKLTADDFLVV